MKADVPIDVTLSAIAIDTREEQPSKALSPIDVTLFGTDTDSSKYRCLNAPPLILVTL